jgi:hypothetical protein
VAPGLDPRHQRISKRQQLLVLQVLFDKVRWRKELQEAIKRFDKLWEYV